MKPIEIVPGVLLRPAALEDAAALAAAVTRNREHLRRWDPRRPEAFFTEAGQRERLAAILDAKADDRAYPMLLVDAEADAKAEAEVKGSTGGNAIVGVINLAGIAMGPFVSAGMGYWIDAHQAGRGIATAAVQTVCQFADERLGLHRIQADTLLDNGPSQRVLAKCGFEKIGIARNYMHIDGRWQDLILHQRILNDRPAA